ncbi:MAG: hypothetical protein VYD53_17055, partial [Pseudomonadota bacterium]|nr:hypothetical protein [Pseudomonadota bacterium]
FLFSITLIVCLKSVFGGLFYGDIGTPSSAIGLSGDDADPDQSIPDFVPRHTHNADWGWVALAGMIRQVDKGGIDETAFAANIAGFCKVSERNDFRFQITGGGFRPPADFCVDVVLNEVLLFTLQRLTEMLNQQVELFVGLP